MLHGHLLLTEELNLQDLKLRRLPGMYVPKPDPRFPDANLNPLFIQDRVVTLDFIKKAMIVRSRERFQNDLDMVTDKLAKQTILPWYGYEQAFVPVFVNGTNQALALIETGADDITMNLDYAKDQDATLESAIKYLPTGEEFPYYRTPLRMSIGHFEISRNNTDVWSFKKMADPLSGLMPDILLGPGFFNGRFVVTFDPFQKRILIMEFSF
jgi:hypothetical protein